MKRRNNRRARAAFIRAYQRDNMYLSPAMASHYAKVMWSRRGHEEAA